MTLKELYKIADYKDSHGMLFHGDCLEIMKDIEDESIDMILCDLPYGTTSCKWDTIIPFEPLWEQYNRTIKDNGAIVLFGSEPFSTLLRYSNLSAYKYDWYWKKGNAKTGHLNAHKRPLFCIETISVFNATRYNPQNLQPYNKVTRRGHNGECYAPSNKENLQAFTNYPTHLLDFPRDKSKVHPTQKPVALLEYLIKTYTNEGNIVLDNCMGSGSTGVACINTNRRFIGIELDENYFNIAKERIGNSDN